MKKEVSNQFTEGLVCDLNPIMTPNTVLTDNLNGTIITYDDNEYSLQNDRGNYALQNCKLRPNYIPVGIKEYSDILYIVSYNPLNNNVEIGSYPSPLTIETSSIDDENHELKSLIGQIESSGSNFSDLIKKAEMKVFYGNNEDEYKIYPGDSYLLEVEDENDYKYEELEYYIVDENRQKYNISDSIKDKNVDKIGESKYDSNDYTNVAWQVPGWLGVQYRLATFEDFSMNIREFVVPNIGSNDFNVNKIKLNFQFKISDKLFLPDNIDKGDLFIKLKASISSRNESKELSMSLKDAEFIEWYEDSKILWIDYDDNKREFKNFFSKMNSTDVITIEATPYFTTDNKTLYYDPFTEKIEIPLNSIGDWDDFRIGSNIWKFWAELEKGESIPSNCYLEFDVTGPIVTSATVNLYYKIYDINGNKLTNYLEVSNYGGISDLNYVRIPFNREFIPEGIYIIELCFAGDANSCGTKNSYSVKRLVIPSQIFQAYVGVVDDFSTITFDEWTDEYVNYLKKNSRISIECQDFKATEKFISIGDFNNIDTIETDPVFKEIWNINNNSFTSFIINDYSNKIEDKTITFVRGVECEGKVLIDDNINILEGPLWSNLHQIISHVGFINSKQAFDYSNLLAKPVNIQTKGVCGNTLNYAYKSYMTGNGPKNPNSIKQCKSIEFFILDCRRGRRGANDYIYYQLRYNKNFNWDSGFEDQFSGFETIASFESKDSDNKIIEVNNKICNKIMEIMNNRDSDFVLLLPIITQGGGSCSDNLSGWSSSWPYEIAVCHGNAESNQSVQSYGTTKIVHPYIGIRYSDLQKFDFFQIQDFTSNYGTYRKECVALDPYESNDIINDYILEIGIDNTFGTLRSINNKITTIIKCIDNDAIKLGSWVKPELISNENNINKLLVNGTFNGINKWIYSDSNIDLLQNSSRKSLQDSLSELNVKCGNLLDGVKSEFKSFILYTKEVSNFYVKDLDAMMDSINLDTESIQQEVALVINKCEEENRKWVISDVATQIESESNPRGIYGPNLEGSFWTKIKSDFKITQNSYITTNSVGSWLNVAIRKNNGKKPNNQNAEANFGYVISNILYQV